MKNHNEKKKKLKLKNENIRKEKLTLTPRRRFTDTLFFLGCSENEKCRVRGESQKDEKKRN